MKSNCIFPDEKIHSTGYSFVTYQGKSIGSHRMAWIKVNGPIPKGMFVDHMCHNEAALAGLCEGGSKCKHRACVNLEHLHIVNNYENMMAGLRNRDVKGSCPKGHLTTSENTMIRKNGKRECSECNRVRARAVYANRKVG